MSVNGRASSERRLTALGTGNWNNRGIDNHIKRPAGCSSAGLKRLGMKRIDGIPHPVGCGNTSEGIQASLNYPKQCLVNNEHVYDAGLVRHMVNTNIDPFDNRHPPAGIEASKTVQYNNYAALSDKERDGPEGGKPPSWLLGQQTKRRVKSSYCITNGDPIKHDYVMPHHIKPRPMRRMGLKGNDGPAYDNGAARLNWNVQSQQRNTGPLIHSEMTEKDWAAVGSRVHISPVGEVRYNVGGKEDLWPACRAEYTKADRPATRLTQYENDKNQLQRFERSHVQDGPNCITKQNPHMMPSPDMVAAMYGHEEAGPAPSDQQSYYEMGPERSPGQGTFAPSELSYDPAAALKPARVEKPRSPQPRSPVDSRASRTESRPSQPPRPMSAREWRGSQGRSSGGGRTPMSARGSDRTQSYRSYRDEYERSIASSYYYSEGDRSQTSRRSKSWDGRSSRNDNQRRDRYGDSRYSESGASQQSGFYSDPSRTVTERALNEALRGSRTLDRTQERRTPRGR